MNLKKVLENVLFESLNFDDIEINNITNISTNCTKNSVYVCLKGKNDGHDYISQAVKNGAVAVICERFTDDVVVQIKVEDARKAFAVICANYYDNPQRNLRFVGVTGTNGKTTTTSIISHVLNNCQIKNALVGTNRISYADASFVSTLTTPDPPELYKHLKDMTKKGISVVVMEISAHAIALSKLFGITFEICCITNITEDHLDYFKTMECYAKTKLDFLLSNACEKVVWCADDEKIAKTLYSSNKMGLSFGIDEPSDVFATSEILSVNGSDFFVNVLDNVFEINTTLIGKFNIENIICAVACTALLGVSVQAIKKGVEDFAMVDGRMNITKLKNGAFAIVDYAHTPDAFEKVLQTLKSLTHTKLTTVFGCGGDRDKEKRPIMGRIAQTYSDKVVVTTDNPRSESAKKIIKDITRDMKHEKIITNRGKAIAYAIKNSIKGEFVAILGKGHEKYQIVGNKKKYFSDAEEVEKFNNKIKKEKKCKNIC